MSIAPRKDISECKGKKASKAWRNCGQPEPRYPSYLDLFP